MSEPGTPASSLAGLKPAAKRRALVLPPGAPATEGDSDSASIHDTAREEGRGRTQLIGLFVGPLALAAITVVPLPLTREQHHLTAVLAFTLIYWISEALPIPVTGLVALSLAALLDVSPGQTRPDDVIFGEFSSPVLFLLIGSFILAQSMIKYDLSRRIALRVLALPGVARSTYLTVIAFGALAVALSSVIENGAVVAMLLPIALGVSTTLSRLIRGQTPTAIARRRLRFSTALMLMTAYGATVGGLLTPIGNPSNLIGRRFIDRELGVRISFFEWVQLATPIVAVAFVVLCLILLVLNRPEVRRVRGARRLVRAERQELGPLSRGEINTLIVFAVAISLWLLPSIVGLVAGDDSALRGLLRERIPPSVVAIIAAALLFVLPVDWRERRFTLSWGDALKIDWGTVLLMGTGLTLGRLMLETGLARLVGESLGSVGGGPLAVYVLTAAVAILLSEMTSNTASVSIVVPIVPALAAAGGGDPLLAAVIATFAGTYGFMLPISTSGNAIVYGSGMIPITKMIRSGFVVDLSGIALIVGGAYVMVKIIGLP